MIALDDSHFYSVKKYDAIWESSLTDTASKGLPDAEIVGFESRCENIKQILDVTNLPLIVDGDTGKDPNSFEYMVKTLESMGVSAVIVEDKVYPKRNSLEEGANQTLENPDDFATKLYRGKQVCLSDDFMIFARLESLISGAGIDDALMRAKKIDGVTYILQFDQKCPQECAISAGPFRKSPSKIPLKPKPLKGIKGLRGTPGPLLNFLGGLGQLIIGRGWHREVKATLRGA